MSRREDRAQKLTDKQRKFVQEFLRDGNATAAAGRAGYRRNRSLARNLVATPAIRAAIDAAHAEVECEAKATLRDWKVLAPTAQAQVEHIMLGRLPPVGTVPETPIIALGRDGATVAKVILDAAREVLERAYPKKLQVEHSGEVRGGVLAVPLPIAQQDWDAMARAQQEKLGRVVAG